MKRIALPENPMCVQDTEIDTLMFTPEGEYTETQSMEELLRECGLLFAFNGNNYYD